MLNIGIKVTVAEFTGLLAKVLKQLPGMSVKSLQIGFKKLLIVQLLPHRWSNVQWEAGLAAEGISKPDSKVLKHGFVGGGMRSGVNNKAFSVIAVVGLLISRFY